MTQTTTKYLVQLDALLDTRLSCANLCVAGISVDFQDNGYIKRVDESLLTAIDGWEKEYAERDLTALVGACHTRMVNWLYAEMSEDMEESRRGGERRQYELHVNIYPYMLSEEELTEMNEVMAELFPTVDAISLVRYRPDTLTPVFLSTNAYYVSVMYDSDEWLKQHIQTLQATPVIGITIIGPQLYRGEVKPEDLPDEVKEFSSKHSPWVCMELAMMELVGLRLIPAEYFSDVLCFK